MNAHFFDLNSLITINSRVWIVDKLNPNKPILKITKSEFNLIRKGVYKKDNINFEISDTKYWISEELYNRLKINSKKNNVDVSSLSFSMKEFMDSEIIDNDDYTIHLENIRHLKNSQADIYIICSKNSRRSYDFIIDKLKDKIADFGLTIKDFYFVSETFYNRDKIDIIHKKIKIALQHLYSTANLGALKLLPKSYRDNPVAYPDVITLKHGEMQQYIGKANLLYQKYWEKLKLNASS